jgi:hypothetical protein
MKTLDSSSTIENIAEANLDRRKFFRKAGYFGLGAAAAGFALSGKQAVAQENASQTHDTFAEIVTAFLIAEDLASTFYYNGLIGTVIQDPALAGPGGSAINISPSGNVGNVNYLQAALIEELEHARLFRELVVGTGNTPVSGDPYQTFYFPTNTFSSLTSFLSVLNSLEDAFIGAYLVLVQELAYKAAQAGKGLLTAPDNQYSAQDYQRFASIAGSILGVECEHRVLGRVIGNLNPANNYSYEQSAGITSVYNGSASAVVALTPFLSPGSGLTGYPVAPAFTNYRYVIGSVTTTGGHQ